MMYVLASGSELVNPGLGLVFWMLITFVLLLWLLRKFAWKPILNAVNQREEGIRSALAAADEAKKEMQNISADNEQLLKEARAEREEMMKQARDMKDKILSEAQEKAEKDKEAILAKAKAEIESEKRAAISEIKAQIADLSLQMAEKVLGAELSNPESQKKLVDKSLEDLKLN